jgi:prevent-host-death family protein
MMAETRNEVATIESLGAAAEEIVERSAAGSPVILTRDGRPVAAVVSLDTLQAFERERELLRRLALGELESAAGEGDDFESVLADCKLLLEES